MYFGINGIQKGGGVERNKKGTAKEARQWSAVVEVVEELKRNEYANFAFLSLDSVFNFNDRHHYTSCRLPRNGLANSFKIFCRVFL